MDPLDVSEAAILPQFEDNPGSGTVFDANGQPPHDAPHQCFLKESREPRAHDGDLLHALQFRAHPSNLEDHASNGSRHHG